ncbi:hypothetical protein [Shewanella xiamenensis]|nr:hypothetical protein [Shewanella xiamenensis]
MTKTATLAVLLKPPTNFPRYLDFTSTQWRWAFKAWLPLLVVDIADYFTC